MSENEIRFAAGYTPEDMVMGAPSPAAFGGKFVRRDDKWELYRFETKEALDVYAQARSGWTEVARLREELRAVSAERDLYKRALAKIQERAGMALRLLEPASD